MGRGDRGGRRVTQPAPARRPQRSLAELCNISFGFFGIQIGFALQNANMSRIFQALGESVDNLAVLWIAAPLTGLLVQPVIDPALFSMLVLMAVVTTMMAGPLFDLVERRHGRLRSAPVSPT